MSDQYEPVELSPEFLEAAQENLEKIADSKIFLTLFTGKMAEEAIPCLQMGLALYLDKPIIVVCGEDQIVPKNLEKVAVAIFRGDIKDPEFQHWLGREISMLR